MLDIIYNLFIAFSFGATNALFISLASSKGVEQGFLDALLGNLKKAVFSASVIAFIMSIYLTGFGLVSELILLIILNTVIIGIYFGKKWKIPTKKQLYTMQISGLFSLILWYAVAIIIFL